MNTSRCRTASLTIWLTSLLLILAGCQSNPSGRVGISDTTEAETESAKVLPTALIEFSDQAARQLTADLAELPRVRNTPGKATILFGDLNNRTQITSTNDFALMTARLRDNLINSDYARRRLRFVADRRRMRDLARREEVGSKRGHQGPAPYDPEHTFVLTGDFYRLGRGGTNQYFMRFELNHFASGDALFSNSYEVKQVKN